MNGDAFERSLQFVLKVEGGYSDDPADPGGETKYGISKASYPHEDIAALTLDRARSIYFRDYWEPSGASALSWPLCLVVFDAAVNHGLSPARSFLTTSGGDWREFILQRVHFYLDLATDPVRRKYLRGWLNRLVALWEEARRP